MNDLGSDVKSPLLAWSVRREMLKRRGRYLIPNSVTVGSMFCGFLSIIYGASGRYEKGAIAIAIAILLDGLDGRVARRLNATSKFGVEFDSLSDLISFGVAPALLVYHWCFREQMRADQFGVLVSFLYVVCAASRLARFNIRPPNTKCFEGLPSPAAAGMVAAFVNAGLSLENGSIPVSVSVVLMLLLGWLMVSTIEFASIKDMKLRTVHPLVPVAVGALIGLLWYSSALGFLLLAGGYCLSGPYKWLRLKWLRQGR